MKIKKQVKRFILVLLIIALLIVGFLSIKDKFIGDSKEGIKELDKIEKYGYSLKETKSSEYKKLFKELKKILEKDEVDEEEYVSKISEMFIYDFYSLSNKKAKTDIGGVDFVYNEILPNFLQNAQDTYYKYVESNIYNNRTQSLPTVKDIEITDVKTEAFAYGDNTDDKAYIVEATWDYTDSQFSKYQKEATLVFVHDNNKLSLVELK